MSVHDGLLAAWLVDALDPPEALGVAERVARSPEAQQRARALDQWLSVGRVLPLPAAGVAVGPLAWGAAAPQSLDMSRTVAPGDRVVVVLQAVARPQDWQVCVLRWQGDDWTLRWPTSAEERTPLSALRSLDGGHELMLVADPDPGVQQWAVVLWPLAQAVDWDLPPPARWAPLFAAVAARRVPAVRVTVAVAGPGRSP